MPARGARRRPRASGAKLRQRQDKLGVVDTELAKEEQATERYFLALETGSLAVTTRLQRLETFATTSAALQALVARIEVESRSAVPPPSGYRSTEHTRRRRTLPPSERSDHRQGRREVFTFGYDLARYGLIGGSPTG